MELLVLVLLLFRIEGGGDLFNVMLFVGTDVAGDTGVLFNFGIRPEDFESLLPLFCDDVC